VPMGLKKLAPLVLAVVVAAGCAAPQLSAPPRAAAARAAVASAPVRVMPLGASITFGTRSPDGNGYRQMLRRRLIAAGLKVEFVGSRRSGTMADGQNEGHPGFRIDQIADGADGWLAAARPGVVLLNAGTNDTIQNHDLPGAPGRLHALIDRILADRPGVRVLVSTLIPSPIAVRDRRVAAFNAELPGIVAAERRAGRPVYLVDLNGALTAADIGPDRIHPTEAGYAKIADRWYSVLGPLLRGEQHR
jgi:lysophospholipase L1-like esterase